MIKLTKPKQVLFFCLYLAVLIFIAVNAALDGESSSEVSGGFVEFLNALPPYRFFAARIPELDNVVRKLFGHYGLYFVLGVFGFLWTESACYGKIGYSFVNVTSGIAAASLTEIIQIFAENRHPAFTDVIVNYEGYLSAHITISAILLIISVVKKRNDISKTEKVFYLISLAACIVTAACFAFFSKKPRDVAACFVFFCFFAAVFVACLAARFAAVQKATTEK